MSWGYLTACKGDSTCLFILYTTSVIVLSFSFLHFLKPFSQSFLLQRNNYMNIQDSFPLGLTGWISLQSKGLSSVFFNTTVQKHLFFGAQLSLCEELTHWKRLWCWERLKAGGEGALRLQLRQVLKPHGKNILPEEIEIYNYLSIYSGTHSHVIEHLLGAKWHMLDTGVE